MNELTEPSPFERIVEILVRHGVEFVVIGGQAESIFGSPRVTYDTDLCYRRTPENIRRLAAALKELRPTLRGAPADLPYLLDERAIANGNNFTLNTPLGDLDLLGYVEPLGGYDEIVAKAEIWRYAQGVLQVIALDDLIAIKRHISRDKDSESLFQLLAIKKVREEGRS